MKISLVISGIFESIIWGFLPLISKQFQKGTLKMTKYSLIILFMLPFLLKSQSEDALSDWDRKRLADTEHFSQFKNEILKDKKLTLLDLEEALHFADSAIKIWKTQRELDFNYVHQIWRLYSEKNDLFHRLSLISLGDSVIALKHYYTSSRENLSLIDSIAVDNLIQKQKDFFGDFELSERYLLPLEEKVYGQFCGAGGSPPEACYKMLDFARLEDKESLMNWLKSIDPEIQSYAVEGLYYLEKKKMNFTQEEIHLIDHVKMKNRLLIKCEGCFYGVFKPSKLELSITFLEQKYKWFKESGWLR